MINSADVRAQKMTVIEAFAVRARRVTEHSLAQDPKVLLDLSRGLATFVFEPDGTARFCQKYPPEEQLESFAARIRPVMLDGDPVYLPTVLEALGYLLREMPEHQETCKAMKREWNRVDPRNGQLAAYRVEHRRGDETGFSVASDSQLALAWIYGDSIHADPKRQAAAGDISIDERYRSAAHAVARVAVVLRDIWGFILSLHDEQLLQLSDAALQQPVVVTNPDRDQLGRVSEAPLGTEIPAPGEPFGVGWSQMNPHSVPPAEPSPGTP